MGMSPGTVRWGAATDRRVVPALALDVPSRAHDVATARHAVTSFLSDRGVPSVVIDDIELVVSELVTNAVIHPPVVDGDVIHVEVGVAADVVVSVSNIGSATAIPATDAWVPAPPDAASGRGLGIVRRLCDEVAVNQVGDRTVVQCLRHLPDGRSSDGASP
jgi:anti-sigma regulatory factor (Ser/Thr protein kinase)